MSKIKEIIANVDKASTKPDSQLISGEKTTALPVKKKMGRPPGAKNKDTLFKELMTGKFQDIASKDIVDVYKILFDKAKGGDMKAIKLVMDRVAPVSKAVDLADMERKGLVIEINVGSLEQKQEEDLAIEAEYTEVED